MRRVDWVIDYSQGKTTTYGKKTLKGMRKLYRHSQVCPDCGSLLADEELRLGLEANVPDPELMEKLLAKPGIMLRVARALGFRVEEPIDVPTVRDPAQGKHIH